MLKDLTVALSLSNLCFIGAWRWLLVPSSFVIYHQKTPPPLVGYISIILNLLLVAALFYGGIVLSRHFRNKASRKVVRILFVFVLGVTLHALLTQINHPSVNQRMLRLIEDKSVVEKILASVPLTLTLFVWVISLFRIEKVIRVSVTVILIFTPFVLITFSQATLSAINNRRALASGAPTPIEPKPENGRPRVLWMVFDELDFRLAFPERPTTVKLPELDRLVEQSLFAENSYPPAGETFLTMPALLTGRLVSEATRKGPNDLMIKFGDNTEAVSWSSQPNVFSRAHEAGFNTALLGWYHPYCRILGNNLNRCDAESGLLVSGGSQSLAAHMLFHFRNAIVAAPFATFVFAKADHGDLLRRMHVSNLNSIHHQAIAEAVDPNIGVVMVHWPIPHHSNIYNRFEDKISVAAGHSYLDNLELADRTLGEIRRAMESNDTWNSTAVLVTSDHWWRAHSLWKKRSALTTEDELASGGVEDQRIPFILKMPGAREQGLSFTKPFNTVLTQDLLLAILRGEVVGTKGAAAWLDRNRSIGRSPYDERSFR